MLDGMADAGVLGSSNSMKRKRGLDLSSRTEDKPHAGR